MPVRTEPISLSGNLARIESLHIDAPSNNYNETLKSFTIFYLVVMGRNSIKDFGDPN